MDSGILIEHAEQEQKTAGSKNMRRNQYLLRKYTDKWVGCQLSDSDLFPFRCLGKMKLMAA